MILMMSTIHPFNLIAVWLFSKTVFFCHDSPTDQSLTDGDESVLSQEDDIDITRCHEIHLL